MPQPGQRPRPRIESLTDLVFGLALSIGAITLISKQPAKPDDLYQGHRGVRVQLPDPDPNLVPLPDPDPNLVPLH